MFYIPYSFFRLVFSPSLRSVLVNLWSKCNCCCWLERPPNVSEVEVAVTACSNLCLYWYCVNLSVTFERGVMVSLTILVSLAISVLVIPLLFSAL